MKITFLGATNTVTGSKYLLSLDDKNILIDCGLFQGLKELRLRNWKKFPVDAKKIHSIILTHAHLDHSGYIPVLIKNGFTGKIYCSNATKDLCSILLPDSGYLQEEEAKFANKYGYSKHKPALPLYTREEAEESLNQFHSIDFRKQVKFGDQTYMSLIPAGHILGASFVQFKHYNDTVLFSGDIGRPHDPIMYPPSVIQAADYLILESTYGNKLHAKIDPLVELSDIITRTVKRGGTIVIPAFAVGRAQHMLYFMYLLRQSKRIPDVPIYLDSPLARDATEIFRKYAELHRLTPELAQKVCDVATYINTKEESQDLDMQEHSKIIISASGMLEGGRVLHHIRVFAPDPKNTIIFTGYQAAGTRGADLAQGKNVIKIFGTEIPVNAEMQVLSNMSAHADYEEILQWLANFNHYPKKVFITHGEPDSAQSLKQKIEEKFKWQCEVPEYMYSEQLS